MFVEKQRRMKHPVNELPRFDGSLHQWISFKNTFSTMSDARTNISDLEKFLYLRNSLKSEASNKVSVYNVSADNYKNAWQILVDSYEKKRILVTALRRVS